MQDTQYPTSNPNITCVCTTGKETIPIHASLEKVFSPGLNVTWIDPSYKSVRYSTQGSKTTTCDHHTSTCRQHSHAQSVYSFARLYDRNTDMLLVLQ